jgi:glycosyltransferase involved in cell wall biosynthesis
MGKGRFENVLCVTTAARMTRTGPTPILFTHYGDDWFRGSEQLLFDLMTNLDRDRVEPILWCNGAPMADAGRAAGITTYRTPFEFFFDHQSPRFNFSRYRSLVREGTELVRKHGIRILHANSAAPHQWLLPVARTTRRPVLAHLHIDYLRRSRYVCLLHQATLVVGVSRQVIGDFLHDGMPQDRTRVIYNGIDFNRLKDKEARDPRCDLGIAPDAVVIVAAGSLIRRKGQDVLIRAFANLVANRDIHLLIAGEGPDRPDYESLTAELNLGTRVHFLGHDQEISAVYRAADIVALASRAEAFGLVLVEAGYFGLPAVTTRVGGIPEVVEDGVTGLLVSPDDITGLASALARVIDDSSLRRRLGQAAKIRAERLFSVAQMTANFHDTYDKLALISEDRLGWLGNDLTLRPYFGLARSVF